MVKKLIIFFMITICSFGISCCKINISEVQNPFMPEKESDLYIPQKVIVPEMVKVTGGIIVGADYRLYTTKGNFPLERLVQLSDFYIGKYEVTQEQYYSVMWDQKVTVKGLDGVEFQLEPNPSHCQTDSEIYHSFEGEVQKKTPCRKYYLV